MAASLHELSPPAHALPLVETDPVPPAKSPVPAPVATGKRGRRRRPPSPPGSDDIAAVGKKGERCTSPPCPLLRPRRVSKSGANSSSSKKNTDCIPLPSLFSHRIFMPVLPESAFKNNAPLAPPDSFDLERATAAMWTWATAHFAEPLVHINVTGAPSLAALSRAVMNGRGDPDPNAGVIASGALAAAVRAVQTRFSTLRRLRSGYTFTTQSQRDLQRILIAGIMASPYTQLVDGRQLKASDLQPGDVVFVPFPLINLRGSKRVGAKFMPMLQAHVPSLFEAPDRHAFVFGRLMWDVANLDSFQKTFRHWAVRQPMLGVHYVTTQPFGSRYFSKHQHCVPYPGAVRRKASNKALGWLPGAPAGSGPDHPCDPLAAAATRPRNCSKQDAMAGVRVERPLLAVFLGEPRSSHGERVMAMRQLRPCEDCAILSVEAPVLGGGVGMAWAYSSAVFCVHPHGDAPPRKAFFDSLLLGCIPVVLDRDERFARPRAPILPFPWAVNFRKFAVLVSAKTWNSKLITVLRRYSAEDIRRMQLELARVARYLQYDWVNLGEGPPPTRERGEAGWPTAGESGREWLRGRGMGEGDGSLCAEDALDLLLKTLLR